MLKRRLHFRVGGSGSGTSQSPSSSPSGSPASPVPAGKDAGPVPAIMEPEPAAVEPTPVPAVSGYEENDPSTRLGEVVKSPTPSVITYVKQKAGLTAVPSVATTAPKKKYTEEELKAPPKLETMPRWNGVTALASSIYTNANVAPNAPDYFTLSSPADSVLKWNGSQWALKKGKKDSDVTDEMILGMTKHAQGSGFDSWPPGQKAIYFTELDGPADSLTRNRTEQFNWAYEQKTAIREDASLQQYSKFADRDGSDNGSEIIYLNPQKAFEERLSGGRKSKNKAVKSFGKKEMGKTNLWNAAYNAKHITPDQALEALNVSKTEGDEDMAPGAVVHRELFGPEGDDDTDPALRDPSQPIGPTVESPKLAEDKFKEGEDAMATRVWDVVDPLVADLEHARKFKDVTNPSGQTLADLEAERDRLVADPSHDRARATYRQHEIAGEIKAKEATRTAQEERLSQLDRAGELVRRLHGPIPDIAEGVTATADSVGITLDAQTRAEVEAEYKSLYDRFTDENDRQALTRYHDAEPSPVARQTFAQYRDGVKTETVDKTKEEIGLLEAKDKGLETTGQYKERRAKAEKGLAEFITWRDEYAQAARSADTEKMTELNKQAGIDYPVIPTEAGLKKRTAAIKAETAVTTAQNEQAEAKRTTKNEKWKQTQADLGRLNEGLKVGTELLATGSGAIDSLDEAKKAIDGLLGNDGEMGESFTAVQGDILADATKLKSSEDVLSGLTDLQTAARGEGNESPYGEGGSPAQRLAKLLDQPRSQRFGNALGLNEQGEDSLNFGRSQEDIVAQNTEIASHTYEEKDNRYYVNEVQGGMKA